jgi:hypothetical protein
VTGVPFALIGRDKNESRYKPGAASAATKKIEQELTEKTEITEASLVLCPIAPRRVSCSVLLFIACLERTEFFPHGWRGNTTDKTSKRSEISRICLSSVVLPRHPWDFPVFGSTSAVKQPVSQIT